MRTVDPSFELIGNGEATWHSQTALKCLFVKSKQPLQGDHGMPTKDHEAVAAECTQ